MPISRFGLFLKIRGISQAEVARKAKIARTVVNSWATGKNRPSDSSKAIVARVLNESEETLFKAEPPALKSESDWEDFVLKLFRTVAQDPDSIWLLAQLVNRVHQSLQAAEVR